MANAARVDAWLTRAHDAVAAFQAIDNGSGGALAYAYMTSASANLNGWTSSTTIDYLSFLRSLQNPDGGYGLNAAADAFKDGTTNPASTSYTVTMAHHVGPVFLQGYRAGVIDWPELAQQGLRVAAAHQFTTTTGRCLAYSTSPNDWVSTYQVHNVNATAASFLWQVRAIQPIVSASLIVDMTRHLVAAYKPTWSGWAYSAASSTVVQDRDHQSATAEGAHMVCPPLGRECAYQLMVSSGSLPLDPLAHMRLVALPADINSMDPSEPDQTIWLVKGDNWLDEFYAFLTAQATDPVRMAQAAYYAARNYIAASS